MSIRLALSFFAVLGLGIAVLVFSIGPEVRWRASQTLASQAHESRLTHFWNSYVGEWSINGEKTVRPFTKS